jgi:hypothetical protein
MHALSAAPPMPRTPNFQRHNGRELAVVQLRDAETGERRHYYLRCYGSEERWTIYYNLIRQ